MYQAVVPVVRKGRRVRLAEEGSGQVINYAIQMKRQPSHQLMSILLQNGVVTRNHIRELAFLCMDLDYRDRPELGRLFLQEYLLRRPVLTTNKDECLLLFYKLYRANIRLKVNALKWQQASDSKIKHRREEAIHRYYALMEHYSRHLFRSSTATPLPEVA